MQKINIKQLSPKTLQVMGVEKITNGMLDKIVKKSDDDDKEDNIQSFMNAAANFISRCEEWNLEEWEAVLALTLTGTTIAVEHLAYCDVNRELNGGQAND